MAVAAAGPPKLNNELVVAAGVAAVKDNCGAAVGWAGCVAPSPDPKLNCVPVAPGAAVAAPPVSTTYTNYCKLIMPFLIIKGKPPYQTKRH